MILTSNRMSQGRLACFDQFLLSPTCGQDNRSSSFIDSKRGWGLGNQLMDFGYLRGGYDSSSYKK